MGKCRILSYLSQAMPSFSRSIARDGDAYRGPPLVAYSGEEWNSGASAVKCWRLPCNPFAC